MRFQAEHHFHGSARDVGSLLVDPTFVAGLALEDLSLPEVLERRADGDEAGLRLRYEFVGTIDPIARRLIGPGRLAWIQEVHIDLADGHGGLRFAAERDPGRLHGSASFTLTSSGEGTVRRLDGDLVVAVPGVGRMAERRIVPGILRRLDIEARAVDDELGRVG